MISKAFQAGSSRNLANNLTTKDRIAGIEIIEKLQRFIDLNKQQIAHCNFFTRLLRYIREFPFGYLTYLIDDKSFRSYSEEEYKITFRNPVRNEDGAFPFSDGECTSPRRIFVRKEAICALSDQQS